MASTTRSCFRVATALRPIRTACAAACSSPPPRLVRLTGVGFHTLRHTCAPMLIESGLSPLRLQRWMGHHSPAFTLETYGHLIDGDLGPALDLRKALRRARP
jgi:integrase